MTIPPPDSRSAGFPRTDLGEPPPREFPVRPALAGLLAFALAALLLNAEALDQSISLMPYGQARDAGLALIRPPAAFSRALRLGVPRRYLETTLGAWIRHDP